ncbi:hypothetical protein Agabi119p4_8002 [Agaricus bisporus var. burnettii]|uniref:Uncharacterized protein n=1 Tax=Agaricus bisporus var. burnettii TaxID=192524 RepID=A0A8H7C6C3_AGABI|nr:hypothetical protein Agabi119p4_8002 [Agaricus bisporus var. burnettii]
MASRTFTVFQDVIAVEAPKVKPVTSGVMATRSSARIKNSSQNSSTSKEPAPVDKENLHPLTGQRAASTTSKKRKTNVLAVKPSAPLAVKKAKSTKLMKQAASGSPKKRKTSTEALKVKVSVKKSGKAGGTLRKSTTKRSVRKVSELPPLEEELDVNGREAEDGTQASIDSRCYDLTVQPLADVSQAYEVIEPAQGDPATPPAKAKFRKDASTELEIRDFFSSSQTLASLPSTSTACTSSADTVESRKFSTPERKRIYAAFTFSSPSPTSERFRSSSRSGSKSPSKSA